MSGLINSAQRVPEPVLKIIRWRVLPNISDKPGNTHEYPEIPQSKKNTRSYIQNSYPTQPEPDLLPIFFQYQTRPDIEKCYPLGTAYEFN